MKRSQEDLARLLEGWLEGDLDAQDEAAIATLLRSDDADGRFFRREAAWAGELAQVLRGTEGDAILAALQESRRSHSIGRRLVVGVDAFRQRRRQRYGLVAIAALLLVLAGLSWWWATQAEPATIEVVTADQAWLDDIPATADRQLSAGTTARTEADGHLQLALDDGSRLELAGDTRLQLTRPEGWLIDQPQGRCRYSIRPQTRPLVITTEQGRYIVLGTRFELRSGPRRSLLTVDEGLVRVEGRNGISDCQAGDYLRLEQSGMLQHGPRLLTDTRLSAWNLTTIDPDGVVDDLHGTLPLHPIATLDHDARGWQPTLDSHLISRSNPALRRLAEDRRFSFECWFSIDGDTSDLRFGEIAALQLLDADDVLLRELQFRAPAKWWQRQALGSALHLLFVFTADEQIFYANGAPLARVPRKTFDHQAQHRFRFRLSGRGLDQQGDPTPLPITIMAAALYHDALDAGTAARHYQAGLAAPGWQP